MYLGTSGEPLDIELVERFANDWAAAELGGDDIMAVDQHA